MLDTESRCARIYAPWRSFFANLAKIGRKDKKQLDSVFLKFAKKKGWGGAEEGWRLELLLDPTIAFTSDPNCQSEF